MSQHRSKDHRRSLIQLKKSPSNTKVFPLVDLTSDNESNDYDTANAHEPANLTLNSRALEKRKTVIEIGKSEVVLKLNQKILECIERDDRDKAEEYKDCLKDCLSSFGQSIRNQSDMSPGLATLTNHPSSLISNVLNSGLETSFIPPQDQVNHAPVDCTATAIDAQDQSGESQKRVRWISREEWMVVVGEIRARNKGHGKFDEIRAMFKPELDRFTNSQLSSKLNQLKNKKPAHYKSIVKAS
jgi:hypothetical protein